MKRWIVYPKKSNDIIEQLLINRKINNKESFLNPDFERDIHNPFLLSGMQAAVTRIKTALDKKEKIGIFTDYDADGIPGGAILYNLFKKLGIKTEIYIPKREEGYGLNEKGIRILYKKGCNLIITVDLGITGKKEVNIAKNLGLDAIITDHHEIQKKCFPCNALAVIHPDLPGQNYPNKHLCGGAIAWKLVCALVYSIKSEKIKNKNILKWFLDLAAISTITDIVPLLGENRIIAKYGLIVLRKTKNIGLKKLYQTAKIDEKSINSYTVGFQIGPRINAPGRIDNAIDSFRLLTSDDECETNKLAMRLNKINQERQKELEKTILEAKETIIKNNLKDKKIIVINDKKWSMGIVGLVAGKLTEEYCRPVIVLSGQKGKLKGSGRSIDGFHLVEALGDCQKFLISYGGHAKAVGLSLEQKHLSCLYDKLLEIAESKIIDKDMLPKISIDAEIKLSEINLDLIKNLEKFEPYGLGNSRPLFLTKNIKIVKKEIVGNNQNHLKLHLFSKEGTFFKAIGFDLGQLYNQLEIGDNIDIVYSLGLDEWNGNKNISLRIMDLKYEK